MSNDGLSIFDEEPNEGSEPAGAEDKTQVMPAVGKRPASSGSSSKQGPGASRSQSGNQSGNRPANQSGPKSGGSTSGGSPRSGGCGRSQAQPFDDRVERGAERIALLRPKLLDETRSLHRST